MTIKTLILTLAAASSLMAAPKAVVFDFGGVMTKESNRQAVVTFLCETFSLKERDLEGLLKEKRNSSKTDLEFWVDYAKQKNISFPVERFSDVQRKAINPNPEMYTLVEQLKEKGIQVALLSNIDERRATIVSKLGLYLPFSPCLLSCEMGVEKPDPRAYEMLLKILNLEGSEILFIDDLLDNVQRAREVGIDAVLFESTGQIKSEILKRGVEILSAN